jgi:hypothetical protein
MRITVTSTWQSTLEIKLGHEEIPEPWQCLPDELTSMNIIRENATVTRGIWLYCQLGLLTNSVTLLHPGLSGLAFQILHLQNCKLLCVGNLWGCSLIVLMRLNLICAGQNLTHVLKVITLASTYYIFSKPYATKLYVLRQIRFLNG